MTEPTNPPGRRMSEILYTEDRTDWPKLAGVELMRVGWRPKFRPGWRFLFRRPWSACVPWHDHACYGSNEWVHAFTRRGAIVKARRLHGRGCRKPARLA